MKNKLFYLLSISLLFLFACESDDNEGRAIVRPSNLTITLEEDTTNLGNVIVNASADMANFYTINFFDIGKSVNVESNDGSASYEFSESGTYQITVRAHTTFDHFIEASQSITLRFGVPGNNGNAPSTGYTSPMSYENRTLVWNEEFNGTSLNTSDWNYEIGTGPNNNGWGNNELQYYRQENTSVSNGILTIEARDDFFGGSRYTSSRLTTEGKKSFQYGRIDVRAGMPYGQGIWPAIWMLGNSFATSGWPFCGEIDIMEMVGGNVAGGGDNVTHGTAHWADINGNRAQFGDSKKLSRGALADEWHVYSIEWDSTKIEWYFDDKKYHELDITPAELAEFNQPFFFILNVAVGGDWPGPPDNTTTYPQRMFVDYVRVFQ